MQKYEGYGGRVSIASGGYSNPKILKADFYMLSKNTGKVFINLKP